MLQHGAHAATDVTGFGIAGHGLGMARGLGVVLRISAARLPVYDHALALAGGGVKTKGTTSNQAHYQASVRIAAGVDVARAGLIYDPQTAGGLLIALDGDRARRRWWRRCATAAWRTRRSSARWSRSAPTKKVRRCPCSEQERSSATSVLGTWRPCC